MNLSAIYNIHIKDRIRKFLFLNLENSYRVRHLRKMGAKIGKECRINCLILSEESYLIELGDNVVIGKHTLLITHEGSVTVFHRENPNLDLFGKITIGNNTFIGMHCLILPKTKIGNNCIIGAGAVVRGNIPDNSVVVGNPAQIVMTTEQYRQKVFSNPSLFEYKKLSPEEKKRKLLETL